jgi:hypothetical protein
VDAEVDSLHIKRIGIEYLVGYFYIFRVDMHFLCVALITKINCYE